MKLVNSRYNQHFDFNNYFAYYLIIENSKEFLKVVEELYGECFASVDSEFTLSENNEILSISKNSLLIYNYFDLDLNNKKITNEINSRISSIFSSQDFVEDFSKLNQMFIDINDKVVSNFDFELEYDADLTYDKLIKISNYKISEQSTFIDKLIGYIKIYTALKKTKLLVFVGLSDYLSQAELELFLKELEYLDLKCLLVESHQKYNLNFVGKILIDEDLCEL